MIQPFHRQLFTQEKQKTCIIIFMKALFIITKIGQKGNKCSSIDA